MGRKIIFLRWDATWVVIKYDWDAIRVSVKYLWDVIHVEKGFRDAIHVQRIIIRITLLMLVVVVVPTVT